MTIKQKITRNLINIPGWHTKRKIVVIESDDWGSIRMPNREVYEQLLREGIRVDRDPYNRYDSLATADDLQALYEVLTSVKDKNGRNAVITANAIMANPDFQKIEKSNFNQYFYEPFTETLKRGKETQKSFELWKQGMDAGIFRPQFHGREHLNVKRWMETLKSNHPVVRKGFDYGVFGLEPIVDSSIRYSFMPALGSHLSEDIDEYRTILEEGAILFKKKIGFSSTSFIAPCYTWHPVLELTLKEIGIKYLQGMVVQKIPKGNGFDFKFKKNNFLGHKSKVSGLTYLMRNGYFEPSQSVSFNYVDDCLNRVKVAFYWNRPAIISMHRLNVIGAIDEQNRIKNLNILKVLLKEIIKEYPNVEFMSSDQLGHLITKN